MAPPADVSVIFVHGVSGPAPHWQTALLDGVAHAVPAHQRPTPRFTFITARYDPHFAPVGEQSRLGGHGQRPARGGSQAPRLSAQMAAQLGEEIRSVVADCGGRVSRPRFRLPPPMTGEMLLRVPAAGMHEARAYRHDPQVAARVRSTVADAVDSAPGLRVVVAHSLGSIVALDTLHTEGVHADMLLTIGSPLGIDAGWRRDPIAPAQGTQIPVSLWLNVVNTRDPVPWGRGVSDHYPEAVDAYISAGLLPFGRGGAHDPATYLGSDVVGQALGVLGGLTGPMARVPRS